MERRQGAHLKIKMQVLQFYMHSEKKILCITQLIKYTSATIAFIKISTIELVVYIIYYLVKKNSILMELVK